MKLLDETQSGWSHLRRAAGLLHPAFQALRRKLNNALLRIHWLAIPAACLALLFALFQMCEMAELRTPETAEITPIAEALAPPSPVDFPKHAPPLFTVFCRLPAPAIATRPFALRGIFALISLLGFALLLHAFRKMNLLPSRRAEMFAWIALAFSTTLMDCTTRVSTEAIPLLLCGGLLYFFRAPPRFDRLLALTLLFILLAVESRTYTTAAVALLFLVWLFFGLRPAHAVAAVIGLGLGTLAHSLLWPESSIVTAPVFQTLHATGKATGSGHLLWLIPRVWEAGNNWVFLLAATCLRPWLKRNGHPREQRCIGFAWAWIAVALLLFPAAGHPLPVFAYALPAIAAFAAAMDVWGRKEPAGVVAVLLLVVILGGHQWNNFHNARSLSLRWSPRQPRHARLVEYLQTHLPEAAVVLAPDSWFYAIHEADCRGIPLRTALDLSAETQSSVTHLLLPEILAPPEVNALAKKSSQRGKVMDVSTFMANMEHLTGARFREITPDAPAFRAYRLFARETPP